MPIRKVPPVLNVSTFESIDGINKSITGILQAGIKEMLVICNHSFKPYKLRKHKVQSNLANYSIFKTLNKVTVTSY
jgi:hypothetical protein